MPRFDGTGPLGQGPRTGWRRGPCGLGLRRNWGNGFGRGFRRFWTKKDELSALEEEEKNLEEELKTVQKEKEALKTQK